MEDVTIKFKHALFIPPASKMQFGYIYFYDLIDINSIVYSKKIAVFASDVVTAQWHLDFYTRNRDTEKILLQFAKNKLIEKYKEGTGDSGDIDHLIPE